MKYISVSVHKKELLDVAVQCYEKGFVTATDGNMSVRISESEILTTATKTVKGRITVDDLVIVNYDGKKIRGQKYPSSELDMHLTIYRNRPDVNAVVHCHPTYATAFALARKPLDGCYIPEVITVLGSVPVTEYATPGTPHLADSLIPFLKNSSAVLLANHGAVTFGDSIYDAFYKMEKLEHYAHITHLALQLGGPVPLTTTQVLVLKNTIEKKGDVFLGTCLSK